MILLDTTVLAYAVGEAHPVRERCQALLRDHADGKVEAVTTFEVLQEFVHVRSRRRARDDAIELGRGYARLLPLLAVERGDLELGLDLFGRCRLGAFEAVLAAVAINRRADGLASADHAFGEVPGLRWIDVGTPA